MLCEFECTEAAALGVVVARREIDLALEMVEFGVELTEVEQTLHRARVAINSMALALGQNGDESCFPSLSLTIGDPKADKERKRLMKRARKRLFAEARREVKLEEQGS